mgnify:CR=1 FL=1
MFGIGLGGGSSHDESSSKQEVWKPQGKALEDMYKQAGGLYGQGQWMNPAYQQFAQSQMMPFMQGLNPYMMQGFGGLMGGGQQGQFASQMNPELQNSLMQSLNGSGQPTGMQQMYADIVGGAGNEYIEPVVNDMYDTMWQNLDRGEFRNSAQKAAQTGNTGNYRRQIDNTLMANEAMNNTQKAENALRAGNYGQDMNWKMQIASQADSNALQDRQNAQNKLMGMYGAADQNTQFGLGQGGAMQQFGMGMASPWMSMMQMPWIGMNNYANILGDPTILGSSERDAGSWNASGNVGFG